MQEANLRDVLARKNFILSKNEFVVLEDAEEHSVTTAETVLVRSICFYYFVDVSSQELDLVDLDELFVFANPYHIDTALVLAAYNRAVVNLAHREDVARCHDSIQDFKC